MAVRQQSIAEMRTKKVCPARHQNTHHHFSFLAATPPQKGAFALFTVVLSCSVRLPCQGLLVI
jgi:hypothetical protein